MDDVFEAFWQMLKQIMVSHDIDVLWDGPNSSAFESLIELAKKHGNLQKAREFEQRIDAGDI